MANGDKKPRRKAPVGSKNNPLKGIFGREGGAAKRQTVGIVYHEKKGTPKRNPAIGPDGKVVPRPKIAEAKKKTGGRRHKK